MPTVECPGCSQTLDVETGTGPLVRCPMCGVTFNTQAPAPPAYVEIPEMVEAPQPAYRPSPVIVQNFVTYGSHNGIKRDAFSGLAVAGFVLALFFFSGHTLLYHSESYLDAIRRSGAADAMAFGFIFTVFISGPGNILALILSGCGLSQIDHRRRSRGRGLALWGIYLSLFSLFAIGSVIVRILAVSR